MTNTADHRRPLIMMLWTAITIPAFLLNIGYARRIYPAFISPGNAMGRLSPASRNMMHPRSLRNLNYSHRHIRHTLSSTLERGTDEKSQGDKVQYNVIYQKVLRARTQKAASTFLLELITYLQSMYELPDGLAMPYETEVPEDDNEAVSDNRAILVIDSPLADDVSQARIEVEVIGIFPDEDENEKEGPLTVGPTMAMVALKKVKSKNGSGNSITEGLFADCERRIIQSFDRGLQDLEEGRVDFSSFMSDEPKTASSPAEDEFNDLDDEGLDAAIKRIGYQNAINAASSDVDISSKDQNECDQVKEPKNPISIERDHLGNVIIDSQASPAASTKKKKQTPKIEANMKVPSQSSNPAASSSTQLQKPRDTKSQTSAAKVKSTPSNVTPGENHRVKQSANISNGEDFAVIMARKKAEALMTTAKPGQSVPFTISGGEGEFAIDAAKRAAAAAAAAAKKQNDQPMSKSSSKGQESIKSIPSSTLQREKPKIQDLSNDPMFMKLQNMANTSKQQSWAKTIAKKGHKSKKKDDGGAKITSKATNAETKEVTPSSKIKATAAFPCETEGTVPQKSDDEIRADIEKIAKGNQEVQDLLQSATDIMIPDVEDDGLSPEELLGSVLKVSASCSFECSLSHHISFSLAAVWG
jgi:hypothetical protein